MRTLIAVTLAVTLTGCALSTPAPTASPVYGPEAYKMGEPRSEAFRTVCAERGGQVIGQDCITQSVGGAIIIPIFEDEAK